MSNSLADTIANFDGVESVEIDSCEIDEDDGGVFPAAISVRFTPSTAGFHALEFITWAFGDIRNAGANVNYYVRSPPPWLNTPGRALSFVAYINPRSNNVIESAQIVEIEQELESITSFLVASHNNYWDVCRANV